MKMVLMQRVSEAMLPAVDLLGPFTLLFTSEDPAPVVFRFDDEDSEWRYDDVINLRAAVAIGAGGDRDR
jgi:hypothetical protein